MTTEEIAQAIIGKSHTPQNATLRMAAIYNLYKEGYKTQHISYALHYHRSVIPYSNQKVLDLLDINDEVIKSSFEQLKEHTIRLVPYFERQDGIQVVKAYVEIDNVKFIY